MNGPAARMLGSAVSWLLFSISFTLLYQVSAVVMGLGGFCASGGPYVIETQCPDAVVIFAPLSIFGGLIAAAIGLFFARGFGTPLVIWAWPILFVGLGHRLPARLLHARRGREPRRCDRVHRDGARAPGDRSPSRRGPASRWHDQCPRPAIPRRTGADADLPHRRRRRTTRTRRPRQRETGLGRSGISVPSILIGVWLGLLPFRATAIAA